MDMRIWRKRGAAQRLARRKESCVFVPARAVQGEDPAHSISSFYYSSFMPVRLPVRLPVCCPAVCP